SRSGSTFNWPAYEPLLVPQPALPGLFSYTSQEINLRFGAVSERVHAQLVTGDYYSTLGVEALLGRTLVPTDDRPAAAPAAVLTYRYWGSRFGFNRRIIGETVYVDETAFTIVGVSPRDFYGLDRLSPPDIICPLHVTPLPKAKSHYVSYFARLGRGESIEHARAQAAVRFRGLLEAEMKPQRRWLEHVELGVVSAAAGEDNVRSRLSEPFRVLGVLVGIVLLTCCSNLATVLMGRATGRSREIGVRLALGASRWRIVRQLLTESALFGVLGGGAGLVVGYWVHHVLLSLLAIDSSVTVRYRLQFPLLAFTASVSLITGVVFGLVPALHATRTSLATVMKGEVPEGGRLRLGPTRTFLVAQVASSVLLLVSAGLFARTMRNLEAVDPGFARDRLLLMTIDPQQSRYPGDRIAGLLDELIERIRGVHGVRSVAFAEWALFGQSATKIVWVRGSSQTGDPVAVNLVGPSFFATTGIPLLFGRDFSTRDRVGAPLVAIVNEDFARTHFPGQNPLGQSFGDEGPNSANKYEIIGVVKDSRFSSLRLAPNPAIFQSFLQSPGDAPFVLHVRLTKNAGPTATAVFRAIRAVDPGLAVYDVHTMTEQVEGTLHKERTFATLSTLFGALALGLCCLGLYGIASYSVTRRTNEIGIRMALGAHPMDVLWLFLRETLVLVAIGVMIGVPIAIASMKVVKSLLFGLTPSDPLSVVAAILALAI